MHSYEGKVVLITGSSRGIGKAMAKKFATAGADIIINYRRAAGSSLAQAEELNEEIKAMGRRTLMVQADISIRASVKKLFSEIKEHFGKLDFLI